MIKFDMYIQKIYIYIYFFVYEVLSDRHKHVSYSTVKRRKQPYFFKVLESNDIFV